MAPTSSGRINSKFDAVEPFLLALPRFADRGTLALKPGLDRMAALMEAMGRPHDAYPSVHVAGTNGKGSTASMLAAIATAAGRRTGLHTSPHLWTLGERMRCDGVPAPKAWIADAVTRFRDVFEAVQPSFFEATTALSFLYFAEEQVDLAVVEAGLGGRLDATNVLGPRLALITGIGLEHTDLLGETVEAIAREKAGIVKHGIPVLTAAAQAQAITAIREVAAARQAPFERVQEAVEVYDVHADVNGLTLTIQTPLRRYDGLQVGLSGGYQQTNALLAVRAAEYLIDALAQDATPVYVGLRDVRRLAGLRGRLEVLQTAPLVLADVAHNADALAAVLAFVQAQRPAGRLFVMLGWLRDKRLGGVPHLLAEADATVFPVHLESPRALAPEALAAQLRGRGVTVEEGGSVNDHLAWFYRHAQPADTLLITGSHQVVAQVPPDRMGPPGPETKRVG